MQKLRGIFCLIFSSTQINLKIGLCIPYTIVHVNQVLMLHVHCVVVATITEHRLMTLMRYLKKGLRISAA